MQFLTNRSCLICLAWWYQFLLFIGSWSNVKWTQTSQLRSVSRKRVLDMYIFQFWPFKCPCSAVHLTTTSSTLSEDSSDPLGGICEQQRFWWDCAQRSLTWTSGVLMLVKHPLSLSQLSWSLPFSHFRDQSISRRFASIAAQQHGLTGEKKKRSPY